MPSATLVDDGYYGRAAGPSYGDFFDSEASAVFGGTILFSANVYGDALFRFAVTASQGETIASASLRLQIASVTNNGSSTAVGTVSAAAEDNAAWPTGATGPLKSANAHGRPRTTATTSVSVTSADIGATIAIDVTAQVQEAVNRAGWVSGGHVLLFLAGADGVLATAGVSTAESGVSPQLTFGSSPGTGFNATSGAWMMIDEQERTP